MYLLTWHGTLVLLTPGVCVPAHLELPIRSTAPPPLDLAIDGDAATHPDLGVLHLRPAGQPGTISLSRGGNYLCAERDRRSMLFDRQAVNEWESFLPVSPQDCYDLQRLLAEAWIVRNTRAAIPRGGVILEPGFRLRLGDRALDLGNCLPLSPRRPDPATPPRHFALRDGENGGEEIEIVLAEPRRSPLLETTKWPVRARQTAEILALGIHRALGGYEPEQAVFERDANFLFRNGGAAALPELIHRSGLLAKPAPSVTPGATSTNPAPQCLVISLGTSCLPACTLRKMGIDQKPMPFDWLRSIPGLVRHCLVTDFAMLLDRTQYISLTGKNEPGEPYDGCDHVFYKTTFGLHRVFNHNDPTRTADYRYMQACVDRFRDTMAEDAPKILFQVREHYIKPEEEFVATVATVEAAGKRCIFLQFALAAPDPSLAFPMLSVVARIGPHVHYRLQPVSQMNGEFFRKRIGFRPAGAGDLAACRTPVHIARRRRVRSPGLAHGRPPIYAGG